MNKELTNKQTLAPMRQGNPVSRAINAIGTDNLSLMIALVILILLITVVSGWFGFSGGDKFFSWQNLMIHIATY